MAEVVHIPSTAGQGLFHSFVEVIHRLVVCGGEVAYVRDLSELQVRNYTAVDNSVDECG